MKGYCHFYLQVSGLLLLTVMVFSPTLSADFVNWDDSYYITKNEHLLSLRWAELFSLFHPDSRVFDTYTPLTLLSFWIDYQLFGLDSGYFHLTNLLLHSLNCLLVFWLFLRLGSRSIIAFFAALVFAIHPMHVESVAWISARKDLLSTCFYLLSLCFYIRWKKPVSIIHASESSHVKHFSLVLSYLFAFLAMLAKPQAVTLIAGILLVDYWFHQKKEKTHQLLTYLPYVAGGLFFALLAWSIRNPEPTDVDFSDRILLAANGLFYYTKSFFIPSGLCHIHPIPLHSLNWLSARWLVPFLFSLGVISSLPFLYRWNRKFFAAALFFIGNILLILPLFKLNSSLTYDRFTYLSYLGLIALLVALVEQYAEPKFDKRLFALITIVCFIFCASSYGRAQIWHSSETLWTDAIQRYPDFDIAYANRANYFAEIGNHQKAVFDFKQSIELNPRMSETHVLIAKSYLQLNQGEIAKMHLIRASKLKPTEEIQIEVERLLKLVD